MQRRRFLYLFFGALSVLMTNITWSKKKPLKFRSISQDESNSHFVLQERDLFTLPTAVRDGHVLSFELCKSSLRSAYIRCTRPDSIMNQGQILEVNENTRFLLIYSEDAQMWLPTLPENYPDFSINNRLA